MYKVVFSKAAQKDASKLKAAHLVEKAQFLLALIAKNPFEPIPPYEKLVGDLHGLYSRRINIQHRLVYEVNEALQTVKVLRMSTHYE